MFSAHIPLFLSRCPYNIEEPSTQNDFPYTELIASPSVETPSPQTPLAAAAVSNPHSCVRADGTVGVTRQQTLHLNASRHPQWLPVMPPRVPSLHNSQVEVYSFYLLQMDVGYNSANVMITFFYPTISYFYSYPSCASCYLLLLFFITLPFFLITGQEKEAPANNHNYSRVP